ncbi:MAG: hypothetical protein SGPRY_006507, partial [Prymnesium sp.]
MEEEGMWVEAVAEMMRREEMVMVAVQRRVMDALETMVAVKVVDEAGAVVMAEDVMAGASSRQKDNLG